MTAENTAVELNAIGVSAKAVRGGSSSLATGKWSDLMPTIDRKWLNKILIFAACSTHLLIADARGHKSNLQISLGPEVTVIPGGLFGYLFRSREGTLVVNGYVGTNSGALARPGWGRPLAGPGHAFTVRSVDSGKTWTVWAPDKDVAISRERTPRLWSLCKHEHCSGRMGPATQGSIVELRDGTILMYDHEPEADGDGKFVGRMWTSNDDWKTVQGLEETYIEIPHAVQTMMADNNALVTGMLFWGPVVELPNGVLLATMTGLFKEDKTPLKYTEKSTVVSPNMIQDRSILVRSEDRGRNWKYLSTIAAPPRGTQEGFNETNVIRLTQGRHKGRLIAIIRTGRENPLYQALSDDEGKTWSEPRALNIGGVAPSLIEMANGVLVVSFGHKPEYNDNGNFLAFSLDQGESWTNITRLSSGLTRAYTTVRETAPGELFILYSEFQGGYYRSPLARLLGRSVNVKLQ